MIEVGALGDIASQPDRAAPRLGRYPSRAVAVDVEQCDLRPLGGEGGRCLPPNPDAAPVTYATLPCRRMILSLPRLAL